MTEQQRNAPVIPVKHGPRSRRWRPASGVALRFALTIASTALISSVALLSSCSSKSSGSPAPTGGTSSSGFQAAVDLPDAAPVTCVAKEGETILGKRPVDIIFAIDNSSSMTEEINEVEKQINENFTSIIEASNTDYRVIMLSSHGAHAVPGAGSGDPNEVQHICVRAPLGGTTCEPIPLRPVETPKFIHHDIVVNSQDSFCRILETFRGPDNKGAHPKGWSEFLRTSAFKLFAVITDDRVNTKCNGLTYDDKTDDIVSGTNVAKTFDNVLLSMSPAQFGTAARRNYVWHSIIGVAPFDANDLGKPHPPGGPIVTKVCGPSVEAPATGYQALSKLTGGLRYPTCGLDFTTIFREMALDVINKTVLACDYALPSNPAEGAIDPATAVVRYTSGGKSADFVQVPDLAACGPGKFYIQDATIRLCDDACGTIRSDPAAKVQLLFGCLAKGTQ